MIFKLGPIETSDILVIINIFITSVFSFLLWRATVAANKTAKAIKASNEKEKKMIDHQNRVLLIINVLKIKNILLSHSEEKGITRSSEKEIGMAIKHIKEFKDLASYFKENEIKSIRDFIDYVEQDFAKIFRQLAPSLRLNASKEERKIYREKMKEYNRRHTPKVKEALRKIEELEKNIQ